MFADIVMESPEDTTGAKNDYFIKVIDTERGNYTITVHSNLVIEREYVEHY